MSSMPTSRPDSIKTISVSELNIYPIKSCKGTSLTEWATTLSGLVWDRQWLVVKEDGQFLTQRQIPAMAQIKPELAANGADHSLVSMQLSAPGMPLLAFESTGLGKSRQVKVWNDTCTAIDEGPEAAAWLSEYLQTSCGLVRFAPDFVRQVDQKFKRDDIDQVGFADGFPFLLLSEQSLADLNDRLEEKLPMNRFRPNIVVSGSGAFEEDDWKTIRIGEMLFHVVKPCARCVITCTDQETLKVGPEPLRTLSLYRSQMNKIMFGQNLVPVGSGKIRLGDKLQVIS